METKNLDEFVKQYHKAIVLSLGKEIKTTNDKIGSILADQWISTLKEPTLNKQAFAETYQQYLQQLGFAERININYNNEKCEIDIDGCAICHGNELLRKEKKGTMCPIAKASSHAMSKTTGKTAKMDRVKKYGITGKCTINYTIN